MFDKLTQENLLYAISIGFGTKVIYTGLRFGKMMLHKKHRNQFLIKEAPWIAIAGICFLLTDFFNSWLVVLSTFGLFTAIYAAHIREQETYPVLRKNAIAKDTIITLVWVGVTIIYPFKLKYGITTNTELIYILMQLFFVAMLTIPFDFRDAESELQKGFSTLPTKYGIDSTKKICRALAMLAWICSGFLGLPFLLLMSVLVVIYLRSLNSINSSWTFEKYTIHFDGLLILQGLILLIMSMLDLESLLV